MSSQFGSGVAQPVVILTQELAKLPGIGPKTASRLAYHILKTSREDAVALAEAIVEVKDRISMCPQCYNMTEQVPCEICADPRRENIICVVQDPLDVVALERTHEFRGKYHVLHGAISPVDGITPDKLRIGELIERVKHDSPDEVIVFTNLDLNGDATAVYLHRQLAPLGVNVSRPASGLPVGSDLEYVDDMTLGRSLAGRRVF